MRLADARQPDSAVAEKFQGRTTNVRTCLTDSARMSESITSSKAAFMTSSEIISAFRLQPDPCRGRWFLLEQFSKVISGKPSPQPSPIRWERVAESRVRVLPLLFGDDF
jgi:hypothetical protein